MIPAPTTEQIKDYWNSLADAEKFEAFESLLDWTCAISDVRYSDEVKSFYWDSSGDDISGKEIKWPE